MAVYLDTNALRAALTLGAGLETTSQANVMSLFLCFPGLGVPHKHGEVAQEHVRGSLSERGCSGGIESAEERPASPTSATLMGTI